MSKSKRDGKNAQPLIVAVITWLLTLGAVNYPASADETPNVLFIAVDDLRDWVGHLDDHSQAKTPNIDPNEWENLVSLSQYESTIEKLKKHLPEKNKR